MIKHIIWRKCLIVIHLIFNIFGLIIFFLQNRRVHKTEGICLLADFSLKSNPYLPKGLLMITPIRSVDGATRYVQEDFDDGWPAWVSAGRGVYVALSQESSSEPESLLLDSPAASSPGSLCSNPPGATRGRSVKRLLLWLRLQNVSSLFYRQFVFLSPEGNSG